jgi:hypothetical protein
MQHSEARIWIAVNVAAEGKQVLAVVEVRRNHPVAGSSEKNIHIRGLKIITVEYQNMVVP